MTAGRRQFDKVLARVVRSSDPLTRRQSATIVAATMQALQSRTIRGDETAAGGEEIMATLQQNLVTSAIC